MVRPSSRVPSPVAVLLPYPAAPTGARLAVRGGRVLDHPARGPVADRGLWSERVCIITLSNADAGGYVPKVTSRKSSNNGTRCQKMLDLAYSTSAGRGSLATIPCGSPPRYLLPVV